MLFYDLNRSRAHTFQCMLRMSSDGSDRHRFNKSTEYNALVFVTIIILLLFNIYHLYGGYIR